MKHRQKAETVSIESRAETNGRTTSFNPYKIVNAIEKSTLRYCRREAERRRPHRQKVVSLTRKESPTLRQAKPRNIHSENREIQDLVETVLMSEGFHETAKAYILYREQHRRSPRNGRIACQAVHLVDKYIGNLDWLVKENANMAYSLQGLNNYVSSAIRHEVLDEHYLFQGSAFDAHESGDLHIRSPAHFRLLLRLGSRDLFFATRLHRRPRQNLCKPAKHLGSILGQMVNFIYTLQGEVAGAQAFSNFDTLLAPFIRKDKLSYEQIEAGDTIIVFNMNVSTRRIPNAVLEHHNGLFHRRFSRRIMS